MGKTEGNRFEESQPRKPQDFPEKITRKAIGGFPQSKGGKLGENLRKPVESPLRKTLGKTEGNRNEGNPEKSPRKSQGETPRKP